MTSSYDLGDINIVHAHHTRWFGLLRFELRYAIVLTELQQAIIETDRLLDHVVLVEKYETITLRDLYKKTIVRRFKTRAQRSKFREQLDDAVKKLKGYLSYNAAPNPDRVFKV